MPQQQIKYLPGEIILRDYEILLFSRYQLLVNSFLVRINRQRRIKNNGGRYTSILVL